MKKFVFLFSGFETLTPEIMEAWNKWFESIGDKMVDSGNPFGPGREITPTGSKELGQDKGAVAGYSIINAAIIDEAEKIARGCPHYSSIRIYEAMPM